MSLPERRPPTHIMRIEIPLHEGTFVDPEKAFRDVMLLVLGLGRSMHAHAICDDPQITMVEVPQGHVLGQRNPPGPPDPPVPPDDRPVA